MTEVAMLKGDDSAMDLTVKCGRITLYRPSSRDQQPVEAEQKNLAVFLHGPGGRRGGHEGDMQSVSLGREWLQQHHRTVIYRSESDSGSSRRYSYPSHFGPMIQNAPPEGVPRRNGCGGAYPVEIGRHHNKNNNDEAMMTAYAMTSLPPFNYYVPEVHCSNDDEDDGEFMTSPQSMTSSHLTQQPDVVSSPPDEHVTRRVYPDCFPFPGNNSNIYGGGSTGVSSGSPGVSTVAAGEQPMPADGPPSSAVAVAPSSPIFFNPRKRFLAEIRKAACPLLTSPSSSSSSEQPNSTSGHQLAPPTPSSSSADVSTPSSTEERRHPGTRSVGGCGGGGTTSYPTEKDEAYWERRRKNNEAAKRSRDIRRQKEEQVAARAASLSAENVQLRAQIEVLKTQLALIQSMVISGAHRQA